MRMTVGKFKRVIKASLEESHTVLVEWYSQYERDGSMTKFHALFVVHYPEPHEEYGLEQEDVVAAEKALEGMGLTWDSAKTVTRMMPHPEEGASREEAEAAVDKAIEDGFTHADDRNMDGYNPVLLMKGNLTGEAYSIEEIDEIISALW